VYGHRSATKIEPVLPQHTHANNMKEYYIFHIIHTSYNYLHDEREYE
jgi:hypothetical protein